MRTRMTSRGLPRFPAASPPGAGAELFRDAGKGDWKAGCTVVGACASRRWRGVGSERAIICQD
jgi:hypothetical protein